LGKCVVCGKETYKILFSDAIVKTCICSEKCLKEYFKPVKGLKTRVACIQKPNAPTHMQYLLNNMY